jgi:hypothetical protein
MPKLPKQSQSRQPAINNGKSIRISLPYACYLFPTVCKTKTKVIIKRMKIKIVIRKTQTTLGGYID